MRIKEFSLHSSVSKTIQEHIERGIPFTECLFRPGSKAFTEFYSQVRQLYNEGKIELDWQDQELLESDIGQCIVVEGETFSLDVPIEIAEEDEDDLLKKRSGKHIRSPQIDAIDAQRQHKLFAPTYYTEEKKVAGMLKEFLEFFHTYEGVSVTPIILETARKHHWTFLLANPMPRPNPDHLKKYGETFKAFTQKYGITFDDTKKAARGVMWKMPRFESPVPDLKTKYTRESVNEEDEDAVRELVLYADNDGDLYQQSAVPIMKNLTRKWRKGVYDSELAAKLWLYHATRAAKNYAQEFGYAFSVQDRKDAAKEFEENWRAELEAGNAMESVQEGVEMCPEACCGKPVTECECGPDCEHCDCYEKNKSLSEADYRGKNVELNKPKRGGSKKFYVYVKNPKTGNIKKVSFGAKGMSVKTDDPERVRNFVARHDCKNRNDKTTASYWSCRLPRYKSLGIKGGQWW